jgi:hypothetical protein
MGQLLIRNEAGTIDVHGGEEIGRIMTALAGDVKSALTEVESASGQRLASPMNPELDDDDPLARLERDSSIEAACDLVIRTATTNPITTEIAGVWLRVSTLASAILAAELGVQSADDRADLNSVDGMTLSLFGALQHELACVIDPSIDPDIHPELYEGVNPETGEVTE